MFPSSRYCALNPTYGNVLSWKKTTKRQFPLTRNVFRANYKWQSSFLCTSTVEQSQELAINIFNAYAKMRPDGNATLEQGDLQRLLRSQGIHLTSNRTAQLLKKIDLNQNNQIEIEEFLPAYNWLLEETPNEEDFAEIFNILDNDKDGTIKKEDLIGVLSSCKVQLTEQEINTIMNSARSINFPTFRALVSRNPNIGMKMMGAYRVVFVVGGPGSGKGTICKKLLQYCSHLHHISSGDLLRKEVKEGTKLGKQVEEVMEKGQLVDASIIITLLDKELESLSAKIVLLDGFPRSLQNAIDFYSMVGHSDVMIKFDCPEEEMIKRIVKRGTLSGRKDDNEETAKRRVEVFKSQSIAAVKYLESKNIHIIRVDTMRPIDTNVAYLRSLPMFADIHNSFIKYNLRMEQR